MWGGGPDSGLYKSENGGETWIELTSNPGMPEGPIGKIGITVSPADPKRLWAVVEANEGGVFRSDDGGASWTRTNDERKIRQRHFYYSRIYADTQDRDTVYALMSVCQDPAPLPYHANSANARSAGSGSAS